MHCIVLSYMYTHSKDRKTEKGEQNGNFHIWFFNLEKISGTYENRWCKGSFLSLPVFAKERRGELSGLLQ